MRPSMGYRWSMPVFPHVRRVSSGPAAIAVAALAVAFLQSGCGPAPIETSSHPTGRSSDPHAPIVLVVLENHESSTIVGASDAPYLNGTLIPAGRLLTNYVAVSHPSLPNYLAMTAGSTLGKSGTDAVQAGELHAPNLFAQLSVAGIAWRAFEESMPSPCYRAYAAGTPPGQYVLKHDPAMTFANVAHSSRCRWVVPFSQLDPRQLPPFSFVTPNECSDMHSCDVSTGDRWLAEHVPPLLSAGALVLVTFDEGSSDIGGGGRIALVEAGPRVPRGTVDARPFDHYSLLAALEDRFGLARLGRARHATPIPLP